MTATDHQINQQANRFKGVRGRYTLYAGLKELDADMAAPTEENHGIRAHRFDEVQWAVVMPSWATSYDVSFYRWVEVVNQNGDVGVAGQWVLEQTLTSQTESLFFHQYVAGDLLAIRVFTIAGAVTTGGF